MSEVTHDDCFSSGYLGPDDRGDQNLAVHQDDQAPIQVGSGQVRELFTRESSATSTAVLNMERFRIVDYERNERTHGWSAELADGPFGAGVRGDGPA